MTFIRGIWHCTMYLFILSNYNFKNLRTKCKQTNVSIKGVYCM